MKTKIELDLKSLLIGAVASAALIFTTGADNAVPNPTEHYAISVGGQGQSVILNTVNGQAWYATLPATVTSSDTFFNAKDGSKGSYKP